MNELQVELSVDETKEAFGNVNISESEVNSMATTASQVYITEATTGLKLDSDGVSSSEARFMKLTFELATQAFYDGYRQAFLELGLLKPTLVPCNQRGG